MIANFVHFANLTLSTSPGNNPGGTCFSDASMQNLSREGIVVLHPPSFTNLPLVPSPFRLAAAGCTRKAESVTHATAASNTCVRNVRPPTQLAHVASNPLILRLLNAALTEGTRHAYKHAVTAFSIPVLRMSQR